MSEQNNYNQVEGSFGTVGETVSSPLHLNLEQRMNAFTTEKNEWRGLNGRTVMNANVEATLADLQEKVVPRQDNLVEKVKRAVLNYSAEGQSLEQIWSEKIAEGANYVAVVDGVFGFYRGEEKLATRNKPLTVSAMPAMMQLRERERTAVLEQARVARMELRGTMGGE